MKQRSAKPPAFTLVELLVVMTIVAILAGLVLSTAGYVQKKAARSRAEAEIKAMEAAMESYKADNGIYPTATATESLKATVPTPATYVSASKELYKALSGDLDGNGQKSSANTEKDVKQYMEFRKEMLSGSAGVANSYYVLDPFGYSYGFSSGTGAVYNTATFDLWSTGGSTVASGTVGWIKNWY